MKDFFGNRRIKITEPMREVFTGLCLKTKKPGGNFENAIDFARVAMTHVVYTPRALGMV